MKNTFLNRFKSIISIKISGKNIYNYINRLIKENINIYNLDIKNRKEAIIKISYNDYVKLKNKKSIYKLEEKDYYGRLKVKKYIEKKYIFYLACTFGIIILIILSNVIFSIEVVHSNNDIRNLIKKELDKNGIHKLSFKKSYDKLEVIENNILEDNKKLLEWLEINVSGTKYIVKVEERKLKEDKDSLVNQDIVASKNAIITKVMASSGIIVKNTNDYVKKGEVIISGNIVLPNGSSVITRADGHVYGEVWYTVRASHPYIYREENVTGRVKEVYSIKFLNKRFSLFDFDKYNIFKSKEISIFENSFSIIKFIKEKQHELNVIDEYYTKEQLIDKIKLMASNKISSRLKNEEYIKNYIVLEETDINNGLELKIFFSVVEEIGEARSITME